MKKISIETLPSKWVFGLVAAACVTTQLGFSGYAIVIKATDDRIHFDALFFSLLRDIGVSPLLLATAFLLEGIQKPLLRHVPVIALMGALLFGNQFFFIQGLVFTGSSSIASIYQPSVPVWTVLLATVFQLEPLEIRRLRGWAKIAGIIAGALGAIVMIGGQFESNESQKKPDHSLSRMLGGQSFLIANTICMAVYVLLQKMYLTELRDNRQVAIYPPVSLTAWIYFFAALSMALCSIYLVFTDPDAFRLHLGIIYPLAYAIVISSGLCYALISWSNKFSSPTIVTAFWPVQVPSTVLLSWIFFGDAPQWFDYVGAVLIILGLLLVSWAKIDYENESKASLESHQQQADSSVVSHFTEEHNIQEAFPNEVQPLLK